MVYITGDTHGDFTRLGRHRFECVNFSKEDYVIICGDFGGVWQDCAEERWWLDWLNEKPFTTLFVDGNHENFTRLNGGEFEEIDFCGGRAHKIRDSVLHLMRGYVFELCGKKFFTFGGASSHDISDGVIDPADYKTLAELKKATSKMIDCGKRMFRIKDIDWWQEELPNYEEMQRGYDNLNKVDNKIDFVITHSAPSSIAATCTYRFSPDIVTEYLQTINSKIEFNKWYFGHYHKDTAIMNMYFPIYENIIRIV